MTSPLLPQNDPNPAISEQQSHLGEEIEGEIRILPPPFVKLNSEDSNSLQTKSISNVISTEGQTFKIQDVADKVLMPSASDTDAERDQKIIQLTKIIDSFTEPENAIPYLLLRVKQNILTQNPENFKAALQDLKVIEKKGSSIELLGLKMLVCLELNELSMVLDIFQETNKIPEWKKKIEDSSPDLAYFADLCQSLLKDNPDLAAMWKGFPDEWRNVILNNALCIISRTPEDPENFKKYFNDAIHRMQKNYNELALDVEYRVEKVFMVVWDRMNFGAAEKLVQSLLDFVYSAKSEDRPSLLKDCLDLLLKSDIDEGTVKNITEAFKDLKAMNSIKPGPSQYFIRQFNLADFDALNDVAMARDTEGSTEHISPWQVLSEWIKAIDQIVSESPELLSCFSEMSESKKAFFNEILKNKDKIGLEGIKQLLKTNYKLFIVEQFFKTNKTSLLVSILNAERAWGVSLLPMFAAEPRLLGYFEKNQPFFRTCASLRMLYSPASVLEMVRKVEPKILMEVFELAQQYPTAVYHFLMERSILNPRKNPTQVSLAYQEIWKLKRDPNLKHLVAPALRLLTHPISPKFVSLFSLKNVDFRNRLLGIDDEQVVGMLLVLSGHFPPNALILRLVAQVNAENASAVKLIMQLHNNNHPLAAWIAKEPVDAPFSKQTMALLTLYAQKENDLLDEALKILSKDDKDRSNYENKVLEWIVTGHYSLASSILKQKDIAFWKEISDLNLPPKDVQKLHSLYLTLEKLMFTDEQKGFIQKVACKLICNKTAPRMAQKWLLWFQMISEGNSIEIETFIASDAWRYMRGKVDELQKLTDKDLIVHMNKLPLVDKLRPVFELRSLKQFTEDVADRLVTASGGINTELIPMILIRIERFKLPGNISSHLKFVLESLQSDPYFSDRLMKMHELPPPNSRQGKLLTALYGKDYTIKDVRKAVVSALLSPVRQENVGSCFGTALVINLNSSLEGLKQSFEDYAALITKGNLTRKDGKVELAYPMEFEKGKFEKNFKRDNFLARIREFTIASMSHVFSELKENTKKFWGNLIADQEAVFSNGLLENDKKIWEKAKTKIPNLEAMIHEKIYTMIPCRYLGFIKKPAENAFGGWVYVDGTTEEPLLTSRKVFESAIKKCLEQVRKDNSLLFTKEELKLFDMLIDQCSRYVSSDEFLIQGLKINQSEIPAFFNFNTEAVTDTALTGMMGGHLSAVMNRYFNRAKVTYTPLPNREHPLLEVFNYIRNLPLQERVAAWRNPRLLKIMQVPRHFMNLKIGSLIKLAEDPRKATEFVEAAAKKNNALMNTLITEQLKNSIITGYLNRCGSSKGALAKIQAMVDEFKPKTIKQLCSFIEYATRTLLPDDENTVRLVKNRLALTISNLEGIKLDLPPLVDVADTNWSMDPSIGFSLNLEGTYENMSYLSKSDTLSERHDRAWETNAWHFVECTLPIDDFSRSYFNL